MHGHIADARLLSRKRKLPHNRQRSWHHLVQFKTVKPQAEIKGIGQRSLLHARAHYCRFYLTFHWTRRTREQTFIWGQTGKWVA